MNRAALLRACVEKLKTGSPLMSRPTKIGGPPYAPVAHGGLSDPRSTGGAPATSSPRRPMLTDRRSTR